MKIDIIMKKLFCLYVSIFVAISIYGNLPGHFFVDLSSQNIAITNITDSFGNYVNIANGSTFELFRDTTDDIGIRHQSYQQYYQGVLVQSHIVLVHSINGIVRCINGSVMPDISSPSTVVPRINRKQAASKAPRKIEEDNITSIVFCLDGKYYSVYKIPSPETFEIYYVDTETGEIVYIESVFCNADVAGRGYTRYNGWQDMTVMETDSAYYLFDDARGIITLSAAGVSPNFNYYFSDSYINSLSSDVISILYNQQSDSLADYLFKYIYSPMMSDYILNSCKGIYSYETDFKYSYIQSITISTASSSWWYDLWDTKPDLYCQIYDTQGRLVYTTSIKDDCSLPVTFTFSSPIVVEKGYVIKIYDEDATSDSYGGSVSINSTSQGTHTWSGSNTSGSIVIENQPMEDCDIHWGMQKTIDFYQTTFNRNSFDGKGHAVINLAFPPYDSIMFSNMPNNAAAQSTFEPFYMYYGAGDGQILNPVVSLDVMAHEFTHMVTGTNGNGGLDYREESGALNESFSDIMAMGVMQYTFGNCPWTIGEDVVIGYTNLRSMSNPNIGKSGYNGQPDTYKCPIYWQDTSNPNAENDNGGVHKNSGVQNYWFYLLCNGGSGENSFKDQYNVTGIGINKGIEIAYRTLIYYLAPNATYEDSRNASIQAAIDLYGKDSPEHKSVVNAWYAVGVGDKYIDESEEPSEYYIVAKRNAGNYYFFTPNKTSNKNRLIAVDAGTSVRADIDTIHTTDDYLWVFEEDKLKSHNGQYLACTAAKSAVMNTTGTELTMTDNSDGSVTFSYLADTETRYLSLATTGNDYFVFYANTNQFTHLFLLPKGKDTTTPISIIEAIPQAHKIIHNGQILILRGNKTYTLTGQEVKVHANL